MSTLRFLDESNTTTVCLVLVPVSSGLSGGAIAGIVIGSLAGVALLAGGVYLLKAKGLLCFS